MKWVDDDTYYVKWSKCFYTRQKCDVLKVSQTIGMSAVQGHYHTSLWFHIGLI